VSKARVELRMSWVEEPCVCPLCGGQSPAVEGPMVFVSNSEHPLCSRCACRYGSTLVCALLTYGVLLRLEGHGYRPAIAG